MKSIKDKLLSFTTKSVDLDMRGQVLGVMNSSMGQSGKKLQKK